MMGLGLLLWVQADKWVAVVILVSKGLSKFPKTTFQQEGDDGRGCNVVFLGYVGMSGNSQHTA